MEALLIVVISGIVATVGGIAVWRNRPWSDTSSHRRQLRETRPCSIAEAPEGVPVRIQGRILEGETVTAPLSHRPCVYFIATVEEYEPGIGDRSGTWRECARDLGSVPFVVEDDTGRAIIDPTHARIDVLLDRATQSGILDNPTASERAFLDHHGLRAQGRFQNKILRYHEGVLEAGELIALVGRAVREPDPDAASHETGYRDAAPHRLRIEGTAKDPILISDSRSVTQGR